VIGLIVFLVVGSGSKKASAGEIFTTPANTTGKNAFTPSVAAPPPSRMPPTSTSSTAPPTTAAGKTAVTGVSGNQPGLYGGTRDNSSCNAKQMLDFLTQNPGKAAAWAAVQRIRPDQLSDYLSQLTPVTLLSDTRVTNHGYVNGKATTIPEILQAGTAVLVDKNGVPRARCFCGNPLTPPVPVSGTPTYTGTKWPGFNPTSVVVVNNSPTIVTSFTLVDLNTGDTFQRQAGGALTGVIDSSPSTSTSSAPGASPSPPQTPSTPSSLTDVVGNYGNLQFTESGNCGGFTPTSGETFKVTVADPSRGVVEIATSTGSYTGTLGSDYSFHFTDPSSTASLDGRFQRKGGRVVMTATAPLGDCSINFTADKVG